MNKVLLIIPAYNEQDSILSTIDTIDEYNKNHSSNKLDYIVINDGSRDRTEEILTSNNKPHVKLVHNLGIGGAFKRVINMRWNIIMILPFNLMGMVSMM